MNVRDCDNCPLLQYSEDEMDYFCGLGFTIDYIDRLESKDGKDHNASKDCKLNFIETTDGVIQPDWIEL